MSAIPTTELQRVDGLVTAAMRQLAEASAPKPIGYISLRDVLATFRKYLYLPDPGPLYVVLGSVAANLAAGDPVWLLLVGPPGSGKTELIWPLSAVRNVHCASTLTEPALLSGTPARDKAQGASGGLLRQIGRFGIILSKDFTSILSMSRDARAAVLAALREIYDGNWTRHVGVDGGRTLSWSGKVGLIAGCTPTIDSHHAVMSAMGERFVLYRLPPVNEEQHAMRALSHEGIEAAMRAELAQAVADLFSTLSPPTQVAIDTAEQPRLIALATLAVRCRSAVERDPHTREVELIPEPEAPVILILSTGPL